MCIWTPDALLHRNLECELWLVNLKRIENHFEGLMERGHLIFHGKGCRQTTQDAAKDELDYRNSCEGSTLGNRRYLLKRIRLRRF